MDMERNNMDSKKANGTEKTAMPTAHNSAKEAKDANDGV